MSQKKAEKDKGGDVSQYLRRNPFEPSIHRNFHTLDEWALATERTIAECQSELEKQILEAHALGYLQGWQARGVANEVLKDS